MSNNTLAVNAAASPTACQGKMSARTAARIEVIADLIAALEKLEYVNAPGYGYILGAIGEIRDALPAGSHGALPAIWRGCKSWRA